MEGDVGLGWLDTLFVGCIAFGLIYSFIVLIFGDSTGDWLAHFQVPLLQPLTWVSGITAFGASGFLLVRLTSFSPATVCLIAGAIGVLLAVAAYFLWVKPMKQTENSTGYSMHELVGKIGEVWTTIPPAGLGEVVITMINGTTNHMATGYEGEAIAEGTRVVVINVKDHVLYVTPFQ